MTDRDPDQAGSPAPEAREVSRTQQVTGCVQHAGGVNAQPHGSSRSNSSQEPVRTFWHGDLEPCSFSRFTVLDDRNAGYAEDLPG
jgi:hypothetical protein